MACDWGISRGEVEEEAVGRGTRAAWDAPSAAPHSPPRYPKRSLPSINTPKKFTMNLIAHYAISKLGNCQKYPQNSSGLPISLRIKLARLGLDPSFHLTHHLFRLTPHAADLRANHHINHTRCFHKSLARPVFGSVHSDRHHRPPCLAG